MPARTELTTTGILCAVGISVAYLFEQSAPTAYMDEIFHFPQTVHYCHGEWGVWDPKITTFPGLYVVGTAYAHGMEWISHVQISAKAMFCSLAVLRSLNLLFGIGNALLIPRLRMMHEYSSDEGGIATLHGLMISLFPVHVFCCFLYYTDPGALFFVLLTVYFAQLGRRGRLRHGPLSAKNIASVLSAFIAVGFRQTNIIWVLFAIGTEIVHDLETNHFAELYGSQMDEQTTYSYAKTLYSFVVLLVKEFRRVLRLFWPHISVVVAFAAFLVVNGSITVGDKSNHVATFHFTQLAYFATIATAGFGISSLYPNTLLEFAQSVLVSLKHRFVLSMLCLILFSFAIFRFSVVHPFLLADNRHYTFYIWHRFFLKHKFMVLVPMPIYMFCIWYCWKQIRKTCSSLRATVFFIATTLVLVPTPLVEPRYFIVPFVMYHIQTGKQSIGNLAMTAFVFTLVNAATIYVYLYRPFTWSDGTQARFMW
ncbi:hypothetical protein Ae201684P_001011 [Aphanomyces euteiches]|nr:hypothetical protein Ae201684P_001011 [Aphanomyces euteiches]KAH9148096.1 hypothetical protein AeRB84_008420 [Aphanomyces euteiches]